MAECVAASRLGQLWVSSNSFAGRDKESPGQPLEKKRNLSALLLVLTLFLYSKELPAVIGHAEGGEPSESEEVTGELI
jgi:hypothetical protein